MTTTTLTLPLPEYLNDAGTPTAHIEYGCRHIGWTLTDPGELHRNRFTWAHIGVREGVEWRGEPLYVTTQRRTSDTSYVRTSFTEAARVRLQAEVVPVIARYGFDRLWTELSRDISGFRSATAARAEAAEARRVADWWDLKAEVTEMHELGVTELKLIEKDPHIRTAQVRVAHPHGRGTTYEPVVAEVVANGERVGWMLRTGGLVPNDELLA